MVYRACRVYGIIGIVGIIGFRVRELKCSRPSPFHRRQGGMTIRRHRWGEEGGGGGRRGETIYQAPCQTKTTNPEGPYTLTMELGPKNTIPIWVFGT